MATSCSPANRWVTYRHWAVWLLLSVVLGALLLTPGPAAAEPPAEYRAALADALQLVERGQGTSGEAAREDFRLAAARLAALAETGSGGLQPMVDELQREAPRADEVAAGLRLLLQTLDAEAAPDWQERGRQALDAALARPALAPRRPNPLAEALRPLADLLDRLGQWLTSALARLFAALGNAMSAGSVAVLSAGLILILAAVLLVLRSLRGGILAGTALAPATLPGARPTAVGTLRLAEERAAQGDWRGAIRGHFLATLLFLIERGALSPDRSLTHGEHLRRLADRPTIAAPLAQLVDHFEPLWYGQRPVCEEDYRRVRDLALAVREVAGQ